MFPQLKKLNNESGIVLFIVLMVSIIIMIFSVGILTQSMNETNYAQQQVDQIVSDELAKGVFWNMYSANMVMPVGVQTVTMQNRTYNWAMSWVSTTNAINSYQVTVNTDTFQ